MNANETLMGKKRWVPAEWQEANQETWPRSISIGVLLAFISGSLRLARRTIFKWPNIKVCHSAVGTWITVEVVA